MARKCPRHRPFVVLLRGVLVIVAVHSVNERQHDGADEVADHVDPGHVEVGA